MKITGFFNSLFRSLGLVPSLPGESPSMPGLTSWFPGHVCLDLVPGCLDSVPGFLDLEPQVVMEVVLGFPLVVSGHLELLPSCRELFLVP